MADTTTNTTVQDDIASLKASRLAAQKAALEAQRQSQLSSLNAQQAKIQPKVDEDKNTSSTTSQLQARNFAEYMAQRGNNNPIGQSGTMNQAEISRGVTLQGQYGAADKWGREQNADIERQRNDVNNNFSNGLTAAQAGIEADAMNALIQYKQQQEMQKLEQDRFDKTYNLQKTTADNSQNNWKTEYDYRKSTADQARTDAGYAGQGLVFDPKTGTYVKSAETLQNEINNKRQTELDSLNKMNVLAQLSGQIPASQLISQMSPEQIASYEALGNQNGGFAAAINATNDPAQKAIITEFRNKFLQQNPNNPYANTQSANVMVPTLQGQQVQSALQTDAVQRAGLVLDNAIKKIQLDKLPEKEQMAIELARLQVEGGKLDNARKTIEVSQLPEQIKVEIAKGWESISASQAQTAQGWKKLDLDQQQINVARTKANNSGSAASNKLDSTRTGTFDDYNQNIKSQFVRDGEVDKQGIYSYLKNLVANNADDKIVDSLANAWNINAEDYEFIPKNTNKTKPANAFYPR